MKNQLTKQEEFEKAKKSILLAEERLNIVYQRLPELEGTLEKKILKHELRGYQDRVIKTTQREIESLQREKVTLEKTIEVLKKNLPGLQRESRIEIASTETVQLYQKAHSELLETIDSVPSLQPLKDAIAVLQEYSKVLEDAKTQYLRISKDLSDVMVKEKLNNLDSVSLDTLRQDRLNINFSLVLKLSDGLIDLNEEINKLQYELFFVSTNNPIEFYLTKPLLDPVNETCNCGLHRREYIPGSNMWRMYENKQSPTYFGKWEWTIIYQEGGFDKKPQFPCEVKSTLEFSPCGRFQREFKISRWVLLQKNDEGWQKIGSFKEKPIFPSKLVSIREEEEKENEAVGQMVYGNESTVKDPDI